MIENIIDFSELSIKEKLTAIEQKGKYSSRLVHFIHFAELNDNQKQYIRTELNDLKIEINNLINKLEIK